MNKWNTIPIKKIVNHLNVLSHMFNVCFMWFSFDLMTYKEKHVFFFYIDHRRALFPSGVQTQRAISFTQNTRTHTRAVTRTGTICGWRYNSRHERNEKRIPLPHHTRAKASTSRNQGRMHGYKNNHKPCNEQSALLRSVPLRMNTILHLEAVEKQSWLGWKLVPLYSAGEFKVQVIKVRYWSAFSSDCQSAWGVMVRPPPTPPAGCPAA